MNSFGYALLLIYPATYLAVFFLSSYFFERRVPRLSRASISSIIWISALIFIVQAATTLIPDQQLSNRALHLIGGGVLASVICFWAIRDAKLQISAFQFFVFSFLMATSLGVANELLEFALQGITHVVFSPTTTDTWLDLTSNTIGALVAGACLLPVFSRETSTDQNLQAVPTRTASAEE